MSSVRRQPTLLRSVAPILGAALAALSSGCMPSTPEGRRAAYLDCARDSGVAVEDGTIRSRGPEDLARLDGCQAIPR